jgi:uncharacterized protein
MIEVKVEAIRVSLMSPNQTVVILKETDGPRCLPIFMGKPESDAIIYRLTQTDVARPLTHDLSISIFESLGTRISHALIHDMHNNHFIAALHLSGGDAETEMDCRPSDAIALALRANAPVFVEEQLLQQYGRTPEGENSAVSDSELSAFSDFIGSLDLNDLNDTDNKDK